MSRDDNDDMDLGDSDNGMLDALYDHCGAGGVRDFSIFDSVCEPVQSASDLAVPTYQSDVSLEVLYDRDGPPQVLDCACQTMLVGAFSSVFEVLDQPEDTLPDFTVSQLFEKIKVESNYSVVKIERISNFKLQELHKAFQVAYNVQNTRTVYHGTSAESSDSILRTGFRGAASVRSKFGKGVYSSKNIWEALAYAQPSPEYNQVFLVATLLQGPTRHGENELLDFGTSASGEQFLTCVDAENTIFCASYGIQLLSEYRVTVHYEVDTATSQQHKNHIRMYHPVIWQVANSSATLPPAPVSVAVLPTGKTTHRGDVYQCCPIGNREQE